MNQTDPSERTYLAVVAAEAGGGRLAEHELTQQPADPLAAAVLAEALVMDAWQVRGGGRASTVSAESAATFHEILQRADQVLHDAIAHNADDPTLWAMGLAPARGLGLGLSEGEYRFQQIRRLNSRVLLAQADYLQFLCPKWYGSWELAEAFAESCLRESPPGSLDAMVVPMVHLEHIIDGDLKAAQTYLKRSGMGAAVTRAAQHSVWHPQFVPRYGWVRAVHTFAIAFALLGDQRNAVALLDRSGPYASRDPWDYFGNPADVIAKVRAGKPLLDKRRRR